MIRFIRACTGLGLGGFLLACAALFAAPSAQAQMWEPTGGPGQGGIVRGAFVPNSGSGDYWAAIYGGGMFKSSDGGNTWTPINNGLTAKRVYAMQTNGVAPYRGYVGTLGGGVFKTTDGGANWAKVNTGLACTYVRALNVSFDSAGADTLLAGTGCGTDSGVYRSVDGGANWSAASGMALDVTVNSISTVAPSSNSVINLRFAGTSDGIYKSDDLGLTWTLSNGTGANVIFGPNGLNAHHVAFNYYGDIADVILVAAVEGGGVFRSTDRGANWTNVLAKPPVAGIRNDVDKNFYAAIDGEGVYRSSDRGATWTPFVSNAALPPVRAVGRNRSVSGSPNFIAETMAGVYRSNDGGSTWSKMSVGLPDGHSINLQADSRNANGDVYAAAADGVHICAGALLPTSGDCSWTKVGGGNLGHMGSGGHVIITSAGLYATTSNLGVFKYDGSNWMAMNNGLPSMVAQSPQLRGDPNNANGLWLGLDERGVYYSADAGASWVAKNGTTLSGAAKTVRHMQVTGSMVLISTNGGLYKSTDNGASWNKLPFPAMSTTATPYELRADHIAVDGATGSIYAAVYQTNALGSAYSDSGLWKSADGGATWTQTLAGRRVHEIRVARNSSGMKLYAGIWEPAPDGGAWQSTDNGATWTQISNGLTNNLINSFGIFNGVLEGVATQGGGVFGFNSATSSSGANYDQVFISRNKNLPEGGENFSVGVRFPRQANDRLKSAVLSCPGGSGSVYTFSSNTAAGNEWGPGAGFGSTPPATPFNCTSTVTYTDGSVNSQTVTIDRFSPANYYVTNVSLQANQNVTSGTSVTWSAPSGTPPTSGFTYQGNVFTSDFSAQLWFFGYTQSTQASYAGPALTPNSGYQMGLTTIEGAGTNVMHAAQTFIPFCFQCTGGSTTTSTTSGSTTSTTASTTTTTLAGGGSANLVAGWNLLGNGLSNAISVSSMFGDKDLVSTVWKWIASSNAWAFYTPTLPDGGAAYAAGKGYTFLTTIDGGEGFWVNAKNAHTVQLSGDAVPTSHYFDALVGANGLPAGWSLIAIGDNKTPGQFVNAIAVEPPAAGTSVATSLTTLWAWDAALAGWYFYAPSLVNAGTQAAYISSKGYLDFATADKRLSPTTGFWVNHP